MSPPRAIHRNHRLGTLEPGKYADFVILTEDPFEIPKERLAEVTAAQTIVGGQVVFTR